MKTKIESKLLLASLNTATGDILYTFEWTFPRIILSEINTHRVLSRNTASSRAIPGKRQRQRVLDDPFIPLHIGANKKGMQAGDELDGWKRWLAEKVWEYSRYPAVLAGFVLDKLGVHKQIVNRVYEPWTWTKQLVSFTDHKNLVSLRAHEAAEPHFQELAYQFKKQIQDAEFILRSASMSQGPTDGWICGGVLQRLSPGKWHLPYITKEEMARYDNNVLCKISSARCARVSYDMPDTGVKSTVDQDLDLYKRLAGSDPKHLSPTEHPAQATSYQGRIGNFSGFYQFRKSIFGESGE